MPTHAKRTDENQGELVAAFKQLGCSVLDLSKVGRGCPDLMIGIAGVNVLVECKTPKGKLNSRQKTWHAEWRGQAAVVRTRDEVVELVQYVRRTIASIGTN